MFPYMRLSRLRRNENLRNLVQETHLQACNFIYPIFVEEKCEENQPISTLPGQYRIAEKNLAEHIKLLYQQNIRSVILFGVSHNKSPLAQDSYSETGLLARMIDIAKNAEPYMLVIADNCFCEYSSHGHCGILDNGHIDNEKSLDILAQQALICAKMGCDMLAPSAMLDGQILTMRQALDDNNFNNIPIMSYAIKYASAFYGPFREAANSAITERNLKLDRKSYQINIANRNEALKEAYLDENEGADILMVKPAGLYLDVISQLRYNSNLPIAAYQVSGEYAAIKFAILNGALEQNSAIIESVMAIKRAGANIIISYFTPEIIKLLNE